MNLLREQKHSDYIQFNYGCITIKINKQIHFIQIIVSSIIGFTFGLDAEKFAAKTKCHKIDFVVNSYLKLICPWYG